jgi:hypothetical protein
VKLKNQKQPYLQRLPGERWKVQQAKHCLLVVPYSGSKRNYMPQLNQTFLVSQASQAHVRANVLRFHEMGQPTEHDLTSAHNCMAIGVSCPPFSV